MGVYPASSISAQAISAVSAPAAEEHARAASPGSGASSASRRPTASGRRRAGRRARPRRPTPARARRAPRPRACPARRTPTLRLSMLGMPSSSSRFWISSASAWLRPPATRTSSPRAYSGLILRARSRASRDGRASPSRRDHERHAAVVAEALVAVARIGAPARRADEGVSRRRRSPPPRRARRRSSRRAGPRRRRRRSASDTIR